MFITNINIFKFKLHLQSGASLEIFDFKNQKQRTGQHVMFDPERKDWLTAEEVVAYYGPGGIDQLRTDRN